MNAKSLTLTPRPRNIVETAGTHKAPASDPVISIDDSLERERYSLEINRDAVAIRAGSEAGIAHARATLAQISAQCDDALPCLQIEDWPDFPRRGFMLDISRNKVPTMESLFKLVDLLAHLKYNELQLYTEHTFAYSGHALVWGDASPMTGDEYDRLNAWCCERHIDLVPNQNSFGHFERWLRYPEYHHLAECPQGFVHPGSGARRSCGSVLKPDEESLAFLGGLFAELLPHFSSGFFNIGCDEVWELGMGWSRPLVDAEGGEEVYLRFLKRIHELVTSNQREMQFWADIIINRPDLVGRLPQNVIPMLWGYEASHPFDEQCRLMAEFDLPFYVVPGNSTWNSFSGRHTNMVENQRSAARHGLRNGARGYLLTSWGDNGNHQTWPTLLPALYLGATLSWYGDGLGEFDLARALSIDCFRDDTGMMADALIALAGLEDGGQQFLRNQSLLFRTFFATAGDSGVGVPALDINLLNDWRARMQDIREGIHRSRPKCADGGWIKDELGLAVDMCELGLRKALAAGDHDVPQAGLRSDWQSVIGRYERLWLNRNRPGGLHASSQMIRDAMPPV